VFRDIVIYDKKNSVKLKFREIKKTNFFLVSFFIYFSLHGNKPAKGGNEENPQIPSVRERK
jgi:hypothetical protein